MYDVIIVGGGPVGMITALGLAQAGLFVRLIEAQSQFGDSPRAAVYHWSVLDGFARLNILEDIERIALKCSKYTYLVKNTGEEIAYSLDPLRACTTRPYNLHLGQHRLVDILKEKIDCFTNVSITLDAKIVSLVQDANGVTVVTEGTGGKNELRCKWVVGADGASSDVRKLLGLSFDGMTWPERFIATNLNFDFEKYGYANTTFVVDARFGAVIAPINHDGLWRCTYMEDCSLPVDQFVERIPKVLQKLLPGSDPYNIEQAAPYRMHQRSAASYRVGRVLLAGDAAHVTNPTGGLGLTSGLFDSFALQEVLPAVVLDGVDDRMLTLYSDARRAKFVNHASPQAVANKEFIFHGNSADDQWREAVANVRRMSVDESFALKKLLFTKTLESPSLLS